MSAILHAALSHTGRRRQSNEDAWADDPTQALFLVSDGIGAEAAGSLASYIVATMLPPLMRQRVDGLPDLTTADAAEVLKQTLVELSGRVYEESCQKPNLRGMGATVVLALMQGNYALIGHMGDSRAYLLYERELHQLTHDHSLIQLLLDLGEITLQEAKEHPARSQITRYVGMAGEALPEVRLIEVQCGDRLLLCSDGLTGMLTNEEVRAYLLSSATPEQACKTLVEAANEAGGEDNVTTLVVDIFEEG